MKPVAFLAALSGATAQNVTHYSKGYKRAQFPANMAVAELTKEDISAAPDAIDWSTKGATTPVKDQGECGSCWAFSTTEGVESGVFMSTGTLPPPLSTQELVSCEKQDDGCNGGDIPEAVSYLKKNGMASETDYPDSSSKSGKTGKCKWNKESIVQVTGMKYAIPPCTKGDCSGQDEEALAAALAKYGPISICINSGDGQSGDWMKYNSGVLKGSCKAKANLVDHCVQLVGYDKTASQPYWKIRNSWAKSFGEEGFIRIPYGNMNSCCVGCEAVIVSATTSGPTPPSPPPTPPSPVPPSPTPPSPPPSPPTPPSPPSDWCPQPDCPKKCQTFSEQYCPMTKFTSYDDCLKCEKQQDKPYIWCDPKYRKAYCNTMSKVVV